MKRNTPPDRLTRDAMAAHAAGMSYGKWKADHPSTGDLEVQEVPELPDGRREIACHKCGKIFVAYGQEVRRKYCTDECRGAAAKAAYRAKNPAKTVPCAVCGNPVDSFHGRKYCSDACRVRACRARDEAKRERKAQKKREKANG